MLDEINFIDAREIICDKVVDFIIDVRMKGFNEVVTRKDVRKSLVQRGKEEDFIVAKKWQNCCSNMRTDIYSSDKPDWWCLYG